MITSHPNYSDCWFNYFGLKIGLRLNSEAVSTGRLRGTADGEATFEPGDLFFYP